MAKEKPFVRPPIKEDKPAPKPTPPVRDVKPAPKLDPVPQLTPQEAEIIRGELNNRFRSLKKALDEAKDTANKDRLRKLLADHEKEAAEWKKKGV